MGKLKKIKDYVTLCSGLLALSKIKTKDLATNHILNFFSNQKGLLLKIAQTKDLLSSENLGISTTAPQLHREEFIQLYERDTGLSCKEVFERFDDDTVSASLSQVYKAYLKSQEAVAVKIKYPGIEEELKNQLELLKSISKLGPAAKWQVQLDEYFELFDQLLREEVDFSRELAHLSYFYKYYQGSKRIHTPQPFEKFCGSNSLVMSWLEGKPLYDLKDQLSLEQKNKLGSLLLDYYFEQILNSDLIHIDSNSGNYLFDVSPEPTIQVVDFGSCYKFTGNSFPLALVRLIFATLRREEVNLLGLYSLLGFDTEKLKHINDCLPALTQALCEPFTTTPFFNANQWDLKTKIQETLGDYKWWFRSAGGLDFFILNKSFVGILSFVKKLDCNLNWQEIFLKHAEPLEKQVYQLEIPEIPGAIKFSSLSSKIHVQVKENQREKVKLTLPISAIHKIQDFLDPETLKKIEQQGISIETIVKNFLRNGAKKEELFSAKQKNKELKVWTV